ncbi:MAG: TIGR02281 family clan AA aspartic protease [Pseudomonadales bacterium]
MRYALIISLSLAAGFAFGWLSRGITGPQPVVQVLVEPDSAETVVPVAAVTLDAGQTQSSFAERLRQVREMLAARRFEAAYDELLILANSAVALPDQAAHARLLAELVDLFTRELILLRQPQRLDEFYEQLTFDYPQSAEYQFKLGKLRVQMGNDQAALPPLAQVSNHARFGAEAREIMAQIERNEARLAFAEVPLRGSGGQFIVEARIDDGEVVQLLVDTGAAMTAIDQRVLQRAGYDLNTEQQYFSTANGVVQAPVLNIGSLSLGEAAVSDLAVGALQLNLAGDVVGLLGMNFLRHYEFRIDQGRGVLVLDQR